MTVGEVSWNTGVAQVAIGVKLGREWVRNGMEWRTWQSYRVWMEPIVPDACSLRCEKSEWEKEGCAELAGEGKQVW